jgi:hypothetical protein
MRPVYDALQFRGTGAPQNEQGSLINVSGTASSIALRTVIGTEGVQSSADAAVDGQQAEFTSEVRMHADGAFTETGRIAFGPGNYLDFETVGDAHIGGQRRRRPIRRCRGTDHVELHAGRCGFRDRPPVRRHRRALTIPVRAVRPRPGPSSPWC